MSDKLFKRIIRLQPDLSFVSIDEYGAIEYIDEVQRAYFKAKQSLGPCRPPIGFAVITAPAEVHRESFVKSLAWLFISVVNLCYVGGVSYDELNEAIKENLKKRSHES